MNRFKTTLQSGFNAWGEAWNQKPMRWFAVLLVLCAAVAYVLAPAYGAATASPKSPPAAEVKTESPTGNAQAPTNLDKDLSERISKLEERERQLYAQSIEASRKTIDWLFSFLAVLTTLVGIAGAFLPWLMGRKDKEQIQRDKEQMQSELQNARELVASIKGAEVQAHAGVKKIDELHDYASGQAQTQGQRNEINKKALAVANNKLSSESDKLRARAVQASQFENPTADQAQTAYELWFALSVLQAQDASAFFNAGYWAQKLVEKCHPPSRSYWFNQLTSHYRNALDIQPNMYQAAYNWGIALSAKAQEVQGQDLSEARRLWREAGEKNAQVLAIRPDYHDAAFSWGIALGAEAQAVQGQDPSEARRLWKQASEKYAQAVAFKPDYHDAASNWAFVLLNGRETIQDLAERNQLLTEAQILLERHANMDEQGRKMVAYNLACVYSLQVCVADAIKQLEVSRLAGELPDKSHLEVDPFLDPVRHSPEFQSWWLQHFGQAAAPSAS